MEQRFWIFDIENIICNYYLKSHLIIAPDFIKSPFLPTIEFHWDSFAVTPSLVENYTGEACSTPPLRENYKASQSTPLTKNGECTKASNPNPTNPPHPLPETIGSVGKQLEYPFVKRNMHPLIFVKKS